jgi:hypothetical protein
VVADVTVSAQGAWAVVLIEGNEGEELELVGTLNVGPAGGVELVVLVGAGAGVDEPNGEGVADVDGVVTPGGAVCAPAFIVAIRATIPASAPRRSHRSGRAGVDTLRIIAGDP